MSDRERKALCCICGSVRTCRRARNHREENYWFSRRIDLDWHRETGELKCQECGRVTTHALLHPEGDWAVDHAEMMQRVATGNTHGHLNEAQLAEVVAKYRQGLPRNPYLYHRWYVEDAQAAWDTGKRTVKALCGETIKLKRDPSGPSSRCAKGDDGQVKPERVRDQEYEDAATGLWWAEIDCVDCLRTWHLELLRRRRNKLSDLMTQFVADLLADAKGYPKKFDLRTVNRLIEALESARDSDEVKAEGSRQ